MNRCAKIPVFMRGFSKKIVTPEEGWKQVDNLISGRKRFMAEIEKYIANEMKETGKSRKQILKESISDLKKADEINSMKKAKKNLPGTSAGLARNSRSRHAKPRQ
jgi:hypothetical protein